MKWATMLVAVAALTFAILDLPLPVDAGFECEKHWSGPDRENSIADCDLPGTYQTRYATIVSIAIPILVMVFTLICFPCVWCCRQCFCNCCGSNKRRPGHFCCGGSEWDDQSDEVKEAAYPAGEVMRAKACTGVLWLLGMACLIVMVVGSSVMGDAYNSFFTELNGLVDWAEAQIGNVETVMTSNGSLIYPLNQTTFSSAYDGTAKMRGNIKDLRSSGDSVYQVIAMVAFGVGVGPVILLVIGACFAVADIRKCGPALLTCFLYIFTIVYALLGTIFFALAAITNDLCDEIDLQLAGRPGFIQWMVVPECNATLDLGSLLVDIENAQVINAQEGCGEFLNICNPGSSFNAGTPNHVYQCALTNAITDCPDFNSFQNIVQGSNPKSGTGNLCNAPYLGTQCTLPQCSTDCTVTTTRNIALGITGFLDAASRALRALNLYVYPLFNCNNLLNIALTPFKKCHSLVQSIRLMAGGATAYAIVFVLAIIAQMRGQKRFFKKRGKELPKEEEEEDPFAATHGSLAGTRRSHHGGRSAQGTPQPQGARSGQATPQPQTPGAAEPYASTPQAGDQHLGATDHGHGHGDRRSKRASKRSSSKHVDPVEMQPVKQV